jgi:hypothetical protein
LKRRGEIFRLNKILDPFRDVEASHGGREERISATADDYRRSLLVALFLSNAKTESHTRLTIDRNESLHMSTALCLRLTSGVESALESNIQVST